MQHIGSGSSIFAQGLMHSQPTAASCSCIAPRSLTPRGPRARRAVDRDLDWEPEVRRPAAAPPRDGFRRPPPPPPPPPMRTAVDWWEVPFTSRRNIALTILGGTAVAWLYTKKVLTPVEIGTPPKDFPFQLAGYTDIAPEDFVYAKTPGGHWIASAQDAEGRVFVIDEIGDLYYDSGNPELGLYAMDTRGNLFNFYNDTDGQRKITPVGNVADLRKFKISEIAGIKLDREVNVVGFADGSEIALPPEAGSYNRDGTFVPPGELIEGVTMPPAGPLERLLGGGRDYPLDRYEVDLSDPTPFSQQLWQQTLLDDPDLPGFQPALPDDLDLQQLAKEVDEEMRAQGRQ